MNKTAKTLLLSQLPLLLAAFSPSLFLAPPATASQKPKLLLAVVVDQFRYDYLLRFGADYKGGIRKLLDQGAVFSDARYRQYPTVTATGHSIFLSGAMPSASGIIGNDWFEREPFIESKVVCPLGDPPVTDKQAGNRAIMSITDESTCRVGGDPAKYGASPRRLLVSTLGDELKMAGRRSKVIGISYKDRAAILPVGHMADAAYWFEDDKAVSSTYYMTRLPDWAESFNKSNPADKYKNANWMPVDAGPQAKPLCSMAAPKDGPGGVRNCGGLQATPFANELLEAFAESAIESENLGGSGDTDVLAISFSANDIVGHAVGPDAPEIRDISIRTDEILGRLLSFIDDRIGKGNTLVVFTADHGVSPSPKVNNDRKMPGGAIFLDEVKRAINAALSEKFGAAKWLHDEGYEGLYFNYEAIQAQKADVGEVTRLAAETARRLHVARVFTRDDLLRHAEPTDQFGRAVSLGFYGRRSADLILLPDPYFMFAPDSKKFDQRRTTHLTPYSYDAHVPLIFMGQGIKAGAHPDPVAINDVAPTLAAMLDVEAPSGSSGRILKEIRE
jgi:predicted AlkP superfamily pyrophosphatase or phosphodiesterase